MGGISVRRRITANYAAPPHESLTLIKEAGKLGVESLVLVFESEKDCLRNEICYKITKK